LKQFVVAELPKDITLFYKVLFCLSNHDYPSILLIEQFLKFDISFVKIAFILYPNCTIVLYKGSS